MATQLSFKQCLPVASQKAIQLRKGSVVPANLPAKRVFAPLSSRRSLALRASANEPESKETEPKTTPGTTDGEEAEGSMMGKFFGTYLQLGVWISVLSYAAYTGYQKSATDPDAVGLLIAPPSAAAFLIGSFLVWRFVLNKDEFSD